ncbi:MAG: cyclic pyranopterin monophosphate synthase MoaC [Alphaproteobacteria bacterium]
MNEKQNITLSHIDADGKATMVDVSDKDISERVAKAKCSVNLQASTISLICDGNIKKGDVLSVAHLAGIMGAKKTSDLIPLCHPLSPNSIEINLTIDEEQNSVNIESTVKVMGKTGVEMEALTAVTIAALTIYDMVKAVDRETTISNIRLTHKSGGKSGDYNAF